MSDSSVVIVGDCYFTKLYLTFKRDVEQTHAPLVVAAKGARVSLLAELERFLRNRSLLLVHLGSWDLAQTDTDAKSVAKRLGEICVRLKKTNPKLSIALFKLPKRYQDANKHYSPQVIDGYNDQVSTFNDTLKSVVGSAAELVSLGLDGNRDLVGESGWCPSDDGNTLIANSVNEVLRRCKKHQNGPVAFSAGVQNSHCDILIIGDRMLSGVRDHLEEILDDAVVVTAHSAWSYILGAISRLLGRCDLRLCFIYLGASNLIKQRSTKGITKIVSGLFGSALQLKQHNPQCRILISDLSTSLWNFDAVMTFNGILWQTANSPQCPWEVVRAAVPFERPKLVAQQLEGVIKEAIVNQRREPRWPRSVQRAQVAQPTYRGDHLGSNHNYTGRGYSSSGSNYNYPESNCNYFESNYNYPESYCNYFTPNHNYHGSNCNYFGSNYSYTGLHCNCPISYYHYS
ncbi:hypothetical protein BIW11_14296 [Tropilaelaps mercedesae]|uniref:Uncharacterized protein n=1 Tax=Tropilaelaps mercedesae TaxID=418985 RepID=A0A1V9WYE6_9ACAR|nr:hypothetical protein BIW11_14296 [Tropilaelaps mercedesae]